eukprot:UN06965
MLSHQSLSVFELKSWTPFCNLVEVGCEELSEHIPVSQLQSGVIQGFLLILLSLGPVPVHKV